MKNLRADKYEKSEFIYTMTECESYKEYEFVPDYDGFVDEIEENNTSYVRLFEPEGPIKGDLVLIHGIGEGNIPYIQWFAEEFARNGIRTWFQLLPYHYKQKKEWMTGGQPFLSADPDYCVQRFHMGIRDTRKILDFVEEQPNHNPENTYIFGLSFGGMIATMAMGIDKRIKKGTLVITGGNWRWINFYSSYAETVRVDLEKNSNGYGCLNEADCVKRFRGDPVEWVRQNIHSVEDIFDKSPIPCYHYDPLSYAPLIDQPVLFIKAAFDQIMPKNATEELSQLIKNKTEKTIPTGHKSSIVLRRQIVRWSLNLFNK
jgi:pimeloyl-ACP methyl ester carboxylesterase